MCGGRTTNADISSCLCIGGYTCRPVTSRRKNASYFAYSLIFPIGALSETAGEYGGRRVLNPFRGVVPRSHPRTWEALLPLQGVLALRCTMSLAISMWRHLGSDGHSDWHSVLAGESSSSGAIFQKSGSSSKPSSNISWVERMRRSPHHQGRDVRYLFWGGCLEPGTLSN